MKNLRASASQLLSGKLPYFYAALAVAVLAFSALGFGAGDKAHIPASAVVAPAPQNAISGEWTADFKSDRPGEIQFNFYRRSAEGGFSMNGDMLRLSELQGLGVDVASAAKTEVNFKIVREAGTFSCEGFFKQGRGAGFWTFEPSRSFVSAMAGRGYGNLTDEDLLRAGLHNLTTKYVDDLKAAGYDRLSWDELNRGVTHEVTPQFIRELKGVGYQGLTMEELIRARNHEISAEYVKEVRAMGFDKQPLEALIRLRNHEITQEFVNQMRSVGFDNLSIEDLIRLKSHEVTPEFVNGLKAEGYAQISPEEAIRLKNHNVDADFIRRAKAKGLTGLSLDQLIRLRNEDIVK
jgi:uncharacterized protein (UPF0335 family)